MNTIEAFANRAQTHPKPSVASVPLMTVMAATALGALGFAAFMAGNVVTDFVGDQVSADSDADLSVLSIDELIGIRSMAAAA